MACSYITKATKEMLLEVKSGQNGDRQIGRRVGHYERCFLLLGSPRMLCSLVRGSGIESRVVGLNDHLLRRIPRLSRSSKDRQRRFLGFLIAGAIAFHPLICNNFASFLLRREWLILDMFWSLVFLGSGHIISRSLIQYPICLIFVPHCSNFL
ncbi:uncharacterized protein LOC119276823 isoform X2 [Triticum dicoccoides]|uniref:uncharacterized protein LOC119276823 isoform X2 n=1 Tax=Triticum dicoccoides TaxID=85692 RepID=UPI00188FB86E|nr:uncharacterized protein LOC119276823 isoform X2 [Triticum dicoccoides]